MSGTPTAVRMTPSGIGKRLTTRGVIAVLRLDSAQQAVRIADALLKGGVGAVEVTLTTGGALDAIAALRKAFPVDVLVGAGSVLDVGAANRALDAGALYLVSPIGVPDLIAAAHNAGALAMLGAFTPTEMYEAQRAHADFVKLFPADTLGPSFLKGVLAPMPSLRVVPTGGITAANAGAWIKAGAVAVGAGSSLVDPALVSAGDWAALTARAQAFTDAVNAARESDGGGATA